MSAPSDGARADARKRLAAEVVAPDQRIVAILRGAGFWGTHSDRWNDAEWQDGFWNTLAAALAEAGVGVIADAKAEAWDERDRARATYPDPHPDDCIGWEDCDCASYPNPYRDVTS